MHASAPHASIPVAQKKYVPIFELGRGGMGNAVLAVVQGPGGFNKLQVVKQLRAELAESPEFLSMFLDEARLSARINHPNVVQTNEVGFDGTTYFIAMEYLEGQSLEALFTRASKKGKLPLSIFLRTLIDACNGLHHAHELQDFDGKSLHVVHRDVSPHNIFVTYDGQTKLLDFGIAKAADSSSETRTGIIKGKVVYMAPEQFRGSDVDRRVDVFAMGAILWRLLAGKRLWKGMSDIEVYQELAAGAIPSPKDVDPEAPQELVDICMKALAPNRDERYETASDLQTALEDFMNKLPERTSQRALGNFVRDLFEDRRAQIRSAIEARLASAINEPPATSAPIELPKLNSAAESLMGPASTSLMPAAHPTTEIPLPNGAQGASLATPQEPARTSRTLPVVVGGLAAVVVLGAVAVFATRPSQSTSEVPVTSTPTPVGAPSSTKPEEKEFVTLTVNPTPGDAMVMLDDATLHGPTKFEKDGAKHRLVVQAPGYQPYNAFIDFDEAGPMVMPISLAPVAATPTTAKRVPQGGGAVRANTPVVTKDPVPVVAASATTATPPSTTPTTTSQNRGDGLDMSDPWGKTKK